MRCDWAPSLRQPRLRLGQLLVSQQVEGGAHSSRLARCLLRWRDSPQAFLEVHGALQIAVCDTGTTLRCRFETQCLKSLNPTWNYDVEVAGWAPGDSILLSVQDHCS
eukprot:4119835-Amphidinium_carterae.2